MNGKGEIFVPIPGHEGRYSISNHGNVLSHQKKDGANRIRGDMLLKPIINSRGYYRVTLYDERGKQSIAQIHRLVIKSFVNGESNERDCANHKDLNKLNNNASNLEWCSKRENTIHAHKSGRFIVTRNLLGGAKINLELANEIRDRFITEKNKPKLAAEYGLTRSTIYKIVNNLIWRTAA